MDRRMEIFNSGAKKERKYLQLVCLKTINCNHCNLPCHGEDSNLHVNSSNKYQSFKLSWHYIRGLDIMGEFIPKSDLYGA